MIVGTERLIQSTKLSNQVMSSDAGSEGAVTIIDEVLLKLRGDSLNGEGDSGSLYR